MNKTEIMDILPHRDDMLLLDEAHLARTAQRMAATQCAATSSSCTATFRAIR